MNQEGKASRRAPPEGLLHDALHGRPLCRLCSQHALHHFLGFRQMLYGRQGTTTLQKKRKKRKITPFDVNSMRSQLLYWAAQGATLQHCNE